MNKNKVSLILFLGSIFLIKNQIVLGEIDLSIKNEIMLVNKPIQTSTKSFFMINDGVQDSLIIHDVLNFKTATPFQNSSTLIIKITDTDKTLITSARITSISTPFDQIPFDIITNSTGFAIISDLSQGNYQFKIEKEGYKTIERSTVIGVGNTYTYIYELEKSSSIPFFDITILTTSLLVACILLKLRTPVAYSNK